jgi:DNA repair exonuclease SbcCD ATPase subunit
MARLTEESKTHNEAAIRAAMERILKGDLPPGGKADLKTLAALAGVTRTGFYPKKNRDGTTRPGAYQHLAEEFERRLNELRDAGEIVDPRIAQIERLKAQNAELKSRIVTRDEQIAQLTEFRNLAISRLAAQHDEIERLRRQVTDNGVVRRLPEATNHIAPFGSCS